MTGSSTQYMKKSGWWLMTLLALAMGLYALRYLVLGEDAYIDILADAYRARPWAIFVHAFFGIFAILIGPLQFLRMSQQQKRGQHRLLGRIYVLTALLTGMSGLFMALYAYGGWPTQFGFAGMSLATVATTAVAYQQIRAREVEGHRHWMIRSYAVIFSAVTFRFWLLLALLVDDFSLAYGSAAWLSWVCNLLFAEWYIRFGKRERRFQRV